MTEAHLATPRPLTWASVLAAILISTGGLFAGEVSGEILFADSFDTNPDGPPSTDWKCVSGEWEVRGGVLRGSGNALIMVAGHELSDCAIECTVRFEKVRNSSRWVSIVYRANPDGKPPYAQFAVRQSSRKRNGLEFAVRTESDEWSVRATRAAPAPGTPMGKPQRLRVEVCGDHVRQYLNGKLVIKGHLAFDCNGPTVGLQTNGATATFDDFKVTALTPSQRVSPLGYVPRALTVAHRGASAHAPENSLAALRLAIRMGAHGVEHDVYVTKDGVPVLMHDVKLDRTTNGKGKVIEHDLAAIQKMRITGPHGEDHPNESIPTLEAALRDMKGKTVPVIEVKEAHTARPVIDAICRTEMVDDVVIISFKDQLLSDVAEIEPRIPTALVVGGEIKGEPRAFAIGLVARARACRANCLNISKTLAEPEVVAVLRSRALAVWVWTVDEKSYMRRLMDLGVTAITTNRPGVLQKLHAEMAAEAASGDK